MNIRPFLFILNLMLVSGLFLGCMGTYDIRFETELINFGEVKEGEDVDVAFVFKNTGTLPVKILEVKAACGCTTADNWDKVVNPGASGKIPVTFKSASYPGKTLKVIDITTNIPERPAIQLTLEGYVIPQQVEVVPKLLWLAEVTRDHKALVGSFFIKNVLDSPFAINEVIPPEGVKNEYTLSKLEKNALNYDYQLDFTLFPPFEGKGRIQKHFTLKADHKKLPEIILPFVYAVK